MLTTCLLCFSFILRTRSSRFHAFFSFNHFHNVLLQGEDNIEYFLGLTPSGIVVLRDKTTVAYYYWPRITKVYFKGRYFMLRVCDKNVSVKEDKFVVNNEHYSEFNKDRNVTGRDLMCIILLYVLFFVLYN